MKRFFLRDGKPCVTTDEIEYQIGVNEINPTITLEGDYTISGDDILEIIPKISESVIISDCCLTDRSRNNIRKWRYASNSEIGKMREEIQDEKDKLYKEKLELECKLDKSENKRKAEISYTDYLKAIIDKHNSKCLFGIGKINYEDFDNFTKNNLFE